MAGDFVVATAGPDLESVLSARGAGADTLSKKRRMAVANLDVGGGTSNIALYQNGALRGTCCLDIGGRLIKVDNGQVAYVYPKLQALANRHGIQISAGSRADPDTLYQICRLMAAQLAQALHLSPMDSEHKGLYTNNGKTLPAQPAVQAITFSGGVADCVYQETQGDVFRYGDIGVLLGRAIREEAALGRVERCAAAETIRATVVGAGTHATDVSGSTIRYERSRLPVKNVPILKVSAEDEASLETLKNKAHQLCGSAGAGGGHHRGSKGGDRQQVPAHRGGGKRCGQGAGQRAERDAQARKGRNLHRRHPHRQRRLH